MMCVCVFMRERERFATCAEMNKSHMHVTFRVRSKTSNQKLDPFETKKWNATKSFLGLFVQLAPVWKPALILRKEKDEIAAAGPTVSIRRLSE
jgi:hypothetical protein